MSVQNNSSAGRTYWQIGRKVWQWCSTREALLLLLIPVIIALGASYFLPQAPAYLRADAFEYQAWLAERQVQFKNWTSLLKAIGAFYIRETIWFRVLLTVLAFVLLVALGEETRVLLNPVTVLQPSSTSNSIETQSLPCTLSHGQVLQIIRPILPHAQVKTDEPEKAHIYASRHGWAKASPAICYLGLLVLTCGLAVHTRWGWWQSEINVLPYEDIALGPDGALRLRLLDLETTPQGGQALPEATLQIADREILPIQLGVPVRSQGYRYLWISQGGPSVRLRAHRVSAPEYPLTLYDYAVRPLSAQTLQFSFASGQEPDRQFILSEDQVVGWLRWTDTRQAEDNDGPEFYLWVFSEDGQELGATAFKQDDGHQEPVALQAEIGGVVYRLEVARYIVLDIARQPGLWVLWLGGILLTLGSLGLLVPRRQTWVQITLIGEQVEIKIREQTYGLHLGLGKRTGRTAARLREAMEGMDLSG